jgi:hypothetical protein
MPSGAIFPPTPKPKTDFRRFQKCLTTTHIHHIFDLLLGIAIKIFHLPQKVDKDLQTPWGFPRPENVPMIAMLSLNSHVKGTS